MLSAGRALIDKGLVDLNFRLDSSESGLLHALVGRQAHVRAIASLLEAGADPNLIDRKGNSPLHLAVVRSSQQWRHP
jgi:ankyrin repeat protein